VFCDGACEPINPGGIATYGYVIYRNGMKVRKSCGLVGVGGEATNNVAEYTAVIKALEYLIFTNRTKDEVIVYSDSQLLIRQLNKIYVARSQRIEPYYQYVIKLLSNFRKISFKWIPREGNEEADSLSKKAYYQYLDNHPDIADKYRRYLISEKQKRYIIMLCRKKNIQTPNNLDRLSKREASKLIENLLNR